VDLVSGLPGALWRHYLAGGPAMHPITFCSLLSLTAIVYKLVVFRRARTDTAELLATVRAALLDGRVAEALAACGRHRGPVAVSVKAGLLKHGSPTEVVERAMEHAALGEIGYLERYLPLLASITAVAPLLGFFGTVIGLIVAFDAVAEQGLGNPGVVAQGMSLALHTTAWGLIVAFVTKPFHDYFSGRVSSYAREMEVAACAVVEAFSDMERIGTKA
jgi:biopolymer transport protein ExbB